MKCSNCKNDVDPNNKFCNHCGHGLIADGDDTAQYLNEMRQFSKDQKESKNLEKFDDLDLSNPTGILKAQLRMLISIYRRLDKLESKESVKVKDFDMPFWSLVGFEFKAFLVGLFFMAIFSCVFLLIFGGVFGSFVSSLLSNIR